MTHPTKFAIAQTGGKQYKIKQGDSLKIEKITAKVGEDFTFDKILLLAQDGQELKIGQPYLTEVAVKAKVLEQGRAKKVEVVKYKPKIRYHKKYGHRQPFTKVQIIEISNS